MTAFYYSVVLDRCFISIFVVMKVFSIVNYHSPPQKKKLFSQRILKSFRERKSIKKSTYTFFLDCCLARCLQFVLLKRSYYTG